MKKAKVVIGANFGDEGKGLMTDYFCSSFPKTEPVLNVRFNGGAQAGHTVVCPGPFTKRHVFGHFGAGSFLPNVATYLSKDFIVNPILFRREYEKLRKLGVYPMVYVHPRCLFTMPQDMLINQFMETRRGKERHGSCGVGVYETILRNKEKQSYVEDFKHAFPRFQIDLSYYDYERIEKTFSVGLTDDEKALLSNQNIRAHYDQDIKFFTDHVSIVDERIFNKFDNVVFEGAQGLMLDQNNMEYFPHLTPSNTGVTNVIGYFDQNTDVEVCYVTRPYLTRHGAGRLDCECSREHLGVKIDATNHFNEWQEGFRYGVLDYNSFVTRVVDDYHKLITQSDCHARMTVALTHTDEIYESLISANYRSDGPTRDDVHLSIEELIERG